MTDDAPLYGQLGYRFVLIRTKYDKSPRACEWGEHHFGELVLERVVVTLVETRPQRGTYDQPEQPDAAWRAQDEHGRNFYSNWDSPYDALSSMGIHNTFTSDTPHEFWGSVRYAGYTTKYKHYFDEIGNVLDGDKLNDPDAPSPLPSTPLWFSVVNDTGHCHATFRSREDAEGYISQVLIPNADVNIVVGTEPVQS